MTKKLLIFLTFNISLLCQSISWTDISAGHTLPEGVKLYEGNRSTPILKAWYLEVDLSNPDIAVRPYISSIPAGKEGIVPFVQRVGAYAGINGGFFDINTASSYSAVVYPDELKALNVQVLNRSGITYHATRSLFAIDKEKNFSIDWIYHFGNDIEGIYRFDDPTPNLPGVPAPAPVMSQGNQFVDIFMGLGGGPTLVKNGTVNVTYNEEVFFGSGVGYDNSDPRTAVGYTADNKVIMLVADGRQIASQGVGLPELAQIMIDLGCVEAMNLDGGGSTQMAVGAELINLPTGSTFQRAIPTILAVVDADSIPYPQTIYYEEIIDTEDGNAIQNGPGWFTSANPGYWGNTPAYLNEVGNGESYYEFLPNIGVEAEYEIFAWWVASSNRCADTPFIIEHKNGTDTVRVNQTMNNSSWVSLGTYEFTGDTQEKIILSDNGTAGTVTTYVCADAVKIVSYDSSTVTSVNEKASESLPSEFILYPNYPNPFNPSTKITFLIPMVEKGHTAGAGEAAPSLRTKLVVYDMLGNEVETLVDEPMSPGTYEITWHPENLSSGVYFCRLTGNGRVITNKMILVK